MRRDFYVYIDEFQTFTTLALVNMFSELRKYRVGFTVAHRYLHQLEPDIRHAVFGNAGTIISFRVGAEDAPYIVQEFHERYEKTYFFAAPELPDVRQARDRWHAVQTVQRYYSRTAAALYRRVAHPLLRMICIRS